jgi:hypothetical protein
MELEEHRSLSVEARVKAHFPTSFLKDDRGCLQALTDHEQAALKSPAEYREYLATRSAVAAELEAEDKVATKNFFHVVDRIAKLNSDPEAKKVEIERARTAAELTSSLSQARHAQREAQRLIDAKVVEDAYKHRNDSEEANRHFLEVSRKSGAAIVLDHEHNVSERHAELKRLAAEVRQKQTERANENAKAQREAEARLATVNGAHDAAKALLEEAQRTVAVTEEVNRIVAARSRTSYQAAAIGVEAEVTSRLQKALEEVGLDNRKSCPRQYFLKAVRKSLLAQLAIVEAELGSEPEPGEGE